VWSGQRLPRENFTLHFIGILIPIKKVAESDPNRKVRSRTKKAYEMILGGELPKEPIKED